MKPSGKPTKQDYTPPWEVRHYYPEDEKLEFPEISPADEKALFIKAKTDPEARALIIRRHLLYVLKIGRRFCSNRLPGDETTSAANEALMKAIDRFDPEHGASFRSFLIPYIRAAIAHCWREREVVDFKHSVPPPPIDQRQRPMAGLDVATFQTVEQDDHNEFLRNRILELAEKLDDRERAVIHLHYVECLDLAEVGRRLKLSRQRIHQIHKSILAALRRKLEAQGITSTQ